MVGFLDFNLGDLINGILSSILNALKSLFSFLLNEAWSFVQWVWSYVPHTLPWPAGAPTPADGIVWILSRQEIQHTLLAMNYYSPVDLFLVLFALALTQEGIIGLWRGIRWLISHIPWIGGD